MQIDDRLNPCHHCGGKILFKVIKNDIATICSVCEHIEIITQEDMKNERNKKILDEVEDSDKGGKCTN